MNAQYQMLKRNQSNAFAWQVSGAALNSDEVDATCKILSDGQCDKWIEEGLDLANLRGKWPKPADGTRTATNTSKNQSVNLQQTR